MVSGLRLSGQLDIYEQNSLLPDCFELTIRIGDDLPVTERQAVV
jgi:hypothetical protein